MGTIDNIKLLVSTAKRLKDPELMAHVLDVQTSVLELKDRLERAEKENKTLKQQLEIKESIFHKSGLYFTKNNEEVDGPFCTRCWDVDNKLVRLPVTRGNRWTLCPECKNAYEYYRP